MLNRREVAKYVVMPIFENLRTSRFGVTYPVQILKHLMTGAPHWAGDELFEPTAGEETLAAKVVSTPHDEF
jgi:hypothetical protein